MLNVLDTNLLEFVERTKEKQLVLWGAGHRAQRICDYLEKPPCFIVDKDYSKCGSFFEVNSWKIPIVSWEYFLEYVNKSNPEEIALLITPTFFWAEIISELNEQDCFSGLECYVMSFILDNVNNIAFSFSKGEQLIPNKIHYCWFGGNPIPKEFQKNIESWKRYNPGYEIIRWDETNYDVTKNIYMRQAYEEKKWGFVSDYARLDILFNEGGYYFDTDVEMIASLEPLSHDSMFCAFFNEITIAIGAGIGAQRYHWMIKEMRDIYDSYSFIDSEGKLNLVPCPYYQQLVLRKNGFSMINSFQKRDGVTIYPTGVFISRDTTDRQKCTEKTIAIHNGSGTWHSKAQREGLKNNKVLDQLEYSYK